MEDWAEIRRLHTSEQLGIKTIARRLGQILMALDRACEEHGPCGVGGGCPAEVRAVAGRFGGGWVRAADPVVAGRVPGQARDGDR
jgi:hypothetical protein